MLAQFSLSSTTNSPGTSTAISSLPPNTNSECKHCPQHCPSTAPQPYSAPATSSESLLSLSATLTPSSTHYDLQLASPRSCFTAINATTPSLEEDPRCYEGLSALDIKNLYLFRGIARVEWTRMGWVFCTDPQGKSWVADNDENPDEGYPKIELPEDK